MEAAAPLAVAVKPNLAFFEAYGSPGLAALERVLAAVPAGVVVVADAKRGDVETTVARQAVALLDTLGADAVTVNPYLGLGALAAFTDRADRFAYVLCRTSNPGAGELQDLVVPADPALDAPAEALHRRVARRVAAAGLGSRAGLVVGATAPAELAAIRAVVPGLAFLVPGVGAQGGDASGRAAGRAGDGRARGPRRRRRAPRERVARDRLGGGRSRSAGCAVRSRGASRRGRPEVGEHARCAIVARLREAAGAAAGGPLPSLREVAPTCRTSAPSS